MRRTRGGTLAEAVITIGLVGMVAGLGVPRLVELARAARVAGAARAVAATLRAARARAIAGAGPVEVRFDAPARHLVVSERDGTPLEIRPLPAGVGFGALPARASVRFGQLGLAENATVTLAAGGHARSVVVNQRGRVRVR